jgi:hypothetical protein
MLAALAIAMAGVITRRKSDDSVNFIILQNRFFQLFNYCFSAGSSRP